MVGREPSKFTARVRFPHPAPRGDRVISEKTFRKLWRWWLESQDDYIFEQGADSNYVEILENIPLDRVIQFIDESETEIPNDLDPLYDEFNIKEDK